MQETYRAERLLLAIPDKIDRHSWKYYTDNIGLAASSLSTSLNSVSSDPMVLYY